MEDDGRRSELMLLIAVAELHRDTLRDGNEPEHALLLEDLERLIERARDELARLANPA